MWATCSSSRTPSAMCKKAGWMDELQELSWWHDITGKSRWLDDLTTPKIPSFFFVSNRHAAPGPELETAQQEEGVQFQMDTLRKLREAGLGWWRCFLRGRYAEKKDNSWVVENVCMAMAIYSYFHDNFLHGSFYQLWKKTHGIYLTDFNVVVETRRFRY